MESAGARVMLMRDGEPTSRFQPQVLAFLGLGVVSIRSRVPFGFPQMGQGRVTPAATVEAHPAQTLLGIMLSSRGRSTPGPFCVPGACTSFLAMLQGQGGPNPGPPELLLLGEKGPPSCDLRGWQYSEEDKQDSVGEGPGAYFGRWEAENPKKGIQGDDSQRRDPDTGTGVPIGRTGERPVAEKEGREGERGRPGAERVCELGTASRSPQGEGRWAEVCDLRSLKTCWLL